MPHDKDITKMLAIMIKAKLQLDIVLIFKSWGPMLVYKSLVHECHLYLKLCCESTAYFETMDMYMYMVSIFLHFIWSIIGWDYEHTGVIYIPQMHKITIAGRYSQPILPYRNNQYARIQFAFGYETGLLFVVKFKHLSLS